MVNQFQSGLSLTDGDYRALGAVVANWALAETVFLGTLRFLHEHPNVENTEFVQERRIRKRMNMAKFLSLEILNLRESTLVDEDFSKQWGQPDMISADPSELVGGLPKMFV